MPQLQQIRRAVSERFATYQTRGKAPESGVPLPPEPFRMGGKHFLDDKAFAAEGVRDVERLEHLAGLTADSKLLDWGCGAGRLAVGVAERFGRVRLYRGVDVQKPLISWAQRHIGKREGFEFVYVDVANERYNPAGAQERRLPASDGEFDVIYAYSVFSHMLSPDVDAYLPEFARALTPGGRAWFTAFVENDVPDEVENPEGYGPLDWTGRLHCVRFERQFFLDKIRRAGLEVVRFEHGQETDGQSMFVVGRAS